MFSNLYNTIKIIWKRIIIMSSKLHFGKGIKIETQEQKNVMSAFCFPFWFLTPLMLVSMICKQYVEIFLSLFSIYLLFFVGVYIYHAIRHPKMLQSEKYQIEYHRIMLMQQTKNPIHLEAQSQIESTPNDSPSEILEIEDKGDLV